MPKTKFAYYINDNGITLDTTIRKQGFRIHLTIQDSGYINKWMQMNESIPFKQMYGNHNYTEVSSLDDLFNAVDESSHSLTTRAHIKSVFYNMFWKMYKT